MLEEFKNFALKGNAFDLAVGVIIGAAFGKIVGSIVDDPIMPVMGSLAGGLDFNNYFLPLSSGVTATSLTAAKEQGAVFAYGSFITILINFLIIAFILFQLVNVSNRLKRAEKAAPPSAPSASERLLGEIRDALVTAKKK